MGGKRQDEPARGMAVRIIPRRYAPLVVLLAVTWALSLGPGLYDPAEPLTDVAGVWRGLTEVGDSEPYHWNYMVFSAVCHSRPERSFSLGGVQMAVNSRCTGFFSGLLFAGLLLPAVACMIYRKKWVLSTLGVLLALQVLDVAGNVAGLWSNTLWTRFWMGWFLGAALLFSIAEGFARPAGRSHSSAA